MEQKTIEESFDFGFWIADFGLKIIKGFRQEAI